MSKRPQVELHLIRDDFSFWLALIPQLSHQQAFAPLNFGLLPYTSLSVYEARLYIESVYPHHKAFLSKELDEDNESLDIIQASRMRSKFFDDTNKQVSGTLGLLDQVKAFYADWFIDSHKGWLAPLKKVLQPDLGVFAYSGHIVGSTHTGLLLSGLNQSEALKTTPDSAAIRNTLYAASFKMGQYLGSISRLPEVGVYSNPHLQLEIGEVKYKDLKATSFFSSIFNGDDSPLLNLSLFLFLTTLNFVGRVLRPSISGAPEALFKIQFLTLYHAVSSIRKLQNYYYPRGILDERSKRFFPAILKDSVLKEIASKRKLRNLLVHYRVDANESISAKRQTSLSAVVEHYFNGTPFAEVEANVDEQVKRVSVILEKWMGWNVEEKRFSSF